MHFALLPNLLQRHVNDNGPRSRGLRGYKGASVKVLPRLRGEGSETNPTWHSNALSACDAARACTCSPCTTACLCQTDSCSSGSCAALILGFFFLNYCFKHHDPMGPCTGCTILIATRYPGSLDSNNWSLLTGSIRNTAP